MTTTTTPTRTARLTVPATEFAAALDAVRFAVGNDPELPVLGGILFDVEGADLHLVATDRYRMAVACAPTEGHAGERVRTTVPTPLADAMRALLADGCEAVLTVDGDAVELETQGRRVAGQGLGEEFPDYRRLTRLPEGRRITLDVPALRRALAGQEGERCALVLTDTVTVAAADDSDGIGAAEGVGAAGDRVGVNPAFLLDALAAGEEMQLEYVGPRAPLVLLRPGTEDAFSLLMPCTLDA